MIIGLGTDLCDIRRIDASLTRFGGRFVSRIFTEKERRRAERVRHRAAGYAKFFAAKEACAKALGTGFRQGVHWRDLGVESLKSGKPYMVLTGGAKARLDLITPPGRVAVINLTLTDEFPTAQAIVIISAETPEDAAYLET